MGIYLNPQNEGFTEAIHSRIYVDKTERITHQCVSWYKRKIYLRQQTQTFWKVNDTAYACSLLQQRL